MATAAWAPAGELVPVLEDLAEGPDFDALHGWSMIAVLVMGGEREGDAASDEAGNDNRPGTCEEPQCWRALSGRAAPGFSLAHPRALSGATLGVKRKAFYPYYLRAASRA